MTIVWIRPFGYPGWCRLLTIGDAQHVTGCLDTVSATEHLELTTREPEESEACPACWRDLQTRRRNRDTRDLRPSARQIGGVVEAALDDMVSRRST